MLEFALALFLTAGPADGIAPTAADSLHPSAPAAAPDLHGDKKSKWKWKWRKSKSKWRKSKWRKSKSKSKSKSRNGNRPVPGPLPLALLGLGVCGVAGARFASKRRRRKTGKAAPDTDK